jgi:hypothetical protein
MCLSKCVCENMCFEQKKHLFEKKNQYFAKK